MRTFTGNLKGALLINLGCFPPTFPGCCLRVVGRVGMGRKGWDGSSKVTSFNFTLTLHEGRELMWVQGLWPDVKLLIHKVVSAMLIPIPSIALQHNVMKNSQSVPTTGMLGPTQGLSLLSQVPVDGRNSASKWPHTAGRPASISQLRDKTLQEVSEMIKVFFCHCRVRREEF